MLDQHECASQHQRKHEKTERRKVGPQKHDHRAKKRRRREPNEKHSSNSFAAFVPPPLQTGKFMTKTKLFSKIKHKHIHSTIGLQRAPSRTSKFHVENNF